MPCVFETFHCRFCYLVLFEKQAAIDFFENLITVNTRSAVHIENDKGMLRCQKCLSIVGDDINLHGGDFYNFYRSKIVELLLRNE